MSERTSLAQADAPDTDGVEVDLNTWTRMMTDLGHHDDSARARALGLHHSVISRLRNGKAKPGPKFIARTLAIGIPYTAVFFNEGES